MSNSILKTIELIFPCRLQSKNDPGFSMTELPNYYIIMGVLASFLIAAGLWMLYYITKTIGLLNDIQTKYSLR